MSDEEEQEVHQEDLVAPTFEEQIKFLRKARKAGTTRFQKTTEFNVSRKLRREGSDDFFDQKIVDDRLQESLNREAHRDFFQDSLGDAVLGKSSTSNHSLRSLFADDDMIVGKPKTYSEDETSAASAVRKVTASYSSDDFYAPQAVRHEGPRYLADDDDEVAGPEPETEEESENGFYHLETSNRVSDFFASTQQVEAPRAASGNDSQGDAQPAPADSHHAVDSNPADANPGDSNPADANPGGGNPGGGNPRGGNPADGKPAGANPGDGKPAGANPADANLAGANHGDASPADASSPGPKKGKATEYTIKLHRPLKVERKEKAPAFNSKTEALDARSQESLLDSPRLAPVQSSIPGESSVASDIPADMKECPRCAELIKKKAIYCRFCHMDLPANEPTQASSPVVSVPTLSSDLEEDQERFSEQVPEINPEQVQDPEQDESITSSEPQPELKPEPHLEAKAEPEAAAVQDSAENLEFEYFMPSVESSSTADSTADSTEDMSFSRNELDTTESRDLRTASAKEAQNAMSAEKHVEQESSNDNEENEKRIRFDELVSKFPLIAADFKFLTGFDLALNENSSLNLWLNACGDRMNLFATELSDQGMQECFVFAQTLIEQYVHSLSNEFGLEFSRSNELVVRQLTYDEEGMLKPGESLRARFPRIDELKALHLAIECSWPATYQLADQFPLKVVFLTETLVRDEDVGARIKFFEDGRPVLFISSTLASRGCPTDLDDSIDGHESWQASLMREFAWKTAVDCNKFPLNPDEYESIGWVSVGDGFYALKTWDGRLYLPYGGAESPEQAWALCDENGEPIDLVGNPVSQPSDLVFISDAELLKVAAHKPCGDHFDTVEDYFVDGLKAFRQGAKRRAELGKINPALYQMVKALDQMGINRCYSPIKTFTGMIRSSTGALVENNIANQKEVSRFESGFAVKK